MNVDRYDTRAASFAGSKNGVSVREIAGGKGEIVFTSTVIPPYTAFDVLGFYNSGRYHWGS